MPEHSYAKKDPACVAAAWSEFGTCMEESAFGLIKCDASAAAGCGFLMMAPAPIVGEISYLACVLGVMLGCSGAFVIDVAACESKLYLKLAECPQE